MKISVSMHTILVLWPLLQLSASLEIDTESTARARKRPFNPKGCQNVVKKVQASGTFTEEAIAPLCSEEMEAGSCEFFSEALALAISHRDFSGKGFCRSIGRAKFCSNIMDKLLESRAVSDLAFGECERAKPEKSIEYCRRIQQMLAVSVKQEDLDTLRACYMTEAYRSQTASRDLESSANVNITIGSEKDLNDAGKGQGPGQSGKTVVKPIVVQPAPLDKFGNGSGNITSPKTRPVVTNLPPSGPLGLPTTLDQFGKGRGNITSPKPTGIITEPIPADIAPAKGNTTPSKPIISEPRPADTAPTRGQTGDSESPPPGPVIVAPPIPKDLKQITRAKTGTPELQPPGPVIVAAPIRTDLKQVQKNLAAAVGSESPSTAPIIWPPPAPTEIKQAQKSLVAASAQKVTLAAPLNSRIVLNHARQVPPAQAKPPKVQTTSQPAPKAVAMHMKVPVVPEAPSHLSAPQLVQPPAPSVTAPTVVAQVLVLQPPTQPAAPTAATKPQAAALEQPKPRPSSQSAGQRSVAQAALMTPLMAPAQAIVALFKSAMGSSKTPGQGAAAQSASMVLAAKSATLATQHPTLGAVTVSNATAPDIAENRNAQQSATASQIIVSRHTAGLVQHQVAHAKATVLEKGKDKKSDYSGFLSKFID